MRPNVNLIKATLTDALGGLLFGFDRMNGLGRWSVFRLSAARLTHMR